MGLIQRLPEHIANQIAAGEVIQRPASVVKELMENAIDASSTSVMVVIKDAGRTLIQVIDDGDGMEEEDASACFLRHATSKISSANDLFQLQTKGFRGEALASIAAIAHVQLKTKHKDQTETGILLNIEGNTIKNTEKTVCPKGSSFEVKNLFYNVPARRNFLKSDTVEFGHIREEFERIVLAHPEIRFSLHHNTQEIYNLQSSNLRKRVVDVLGKSNNERLVPLEEQTNIVKISGFIGKPETARKTRGEQFFFVNNRFFKDAYFHHAVIKAFEGLIPERTFPSYFIFFEIDPAKIDVNIHPTKTEIKFEEDRFIYSILLSSIKQSLGKYNIFPTMDFELDTSFDIPSSLRKTDPVEPQIVVNPNFNPFQATNTTVRSNGGTFSEAMKNQGFGRENPSEKDWANFYSIKEEEKIENLELEFKEELESDQNFLIRGKYLISNCKSGLLIIDVKRATERILYDELMSKFIHQPIVSQQLLFPFEKPIAKNEITAWENNKSLLSQLGFSGAINGEILEITGIPGMLSDDQIEATLCNLFETLLHRDIEKGELAHNIILSIARASSVNSEISDQYKGKILIEQLFQCKDHSYTPGGKKIISTMEIQEIAAKF
jgi:DNA mismatch repair protein MutL